MFHALGQTFASIGLVGLGIVIGGAAMFIWLSFTNRLK